MIYPRRLWAVLIFVALCAAGIQALAIRGMVNWILYGLLLGAVYGAAHWMGWMGWLNRLWLEERRTIRVCTHLFLVLFPFILTVLSQKARIPLEAWIPHATLAMIYVMLAQGLNLIVGFTGLLVLGYAGFYAIGAYTCAILTTAPWAGWWMFWLCVPVAALLGAFSGFGLGAPTLRLRGDYLAIVTLGFGEIVWIAVTNWDGLTNGPKGIAQIPSPALGPLPFNQHFRVLGLNVSGTVSLYYLTLLFCYIVVGTVKRLHASRVGRAWVAIREDELAAEAMGINTVWFKLLAFALSAAIAAVAGVIFAARQGFVDPNSFVFLRSAIILCMVVLGGMGSLSGATIGAVVIIFLEQKLQANAEWRMAFFGLALIVMMVLKPEGLMPSRQLSREMHKF